MKGFVKIVCFFAGIVLLLKAGQVLLDEFYERYGKKYVRFEDV